MAGKEGREMTIRNLTAKQKRDLIFRLIDGRAMAGLNKDLKKAKLERDPREYEKGEKK